MAEADNKKTKSLIRLLKLLQRQPGQNAQVHSDDLKVTVVCGGRSYRFERAAIDQAQGEGLVEDLAGAIKLSATGMAFLKRALHPDEPFQAQHGTLLQDSVKLAGGMQPVTRNSAESPLFRLFTRKQSGGGAWLNEAQFAAGERFRADFEKAGLQPRISANWEASVAASGRGGAGSDISDFALDARKRVEKALAALGPELADIALDICCFLKGLEQVELEQRWPPRSAKLILRTALSVLARHYGLSGEGQNFNGRMRLRQWGADDFRPSIFNG